MSLLGKVDNLMPVPLSVDSQFSQYEAWLSAQPFTENTKRNYATQVKLFLNFVRHISSQCDEGPVTLNQRDLLVEKYTKFLQNSTEACLSSINQCRTAIDNFYQFLGLGPSSIQRVKLERKLPRVLTPGEKHKFVNALEGQASAKEKAIIMLFLCTGLRLNECTALNIDDVSVTAHTGKLTVRKDKYGRDRELSLEESTRKALLSWLLERSKRFDQNCDKALFVNSQGQRLTRSGVDIIVRKIAIRGHLVLSAQVLRDTFLTELAHESKDIFLVAAVGGCANLESARRYFEIAAANEASGSF